MQVSAAVKQRPPAKRAAGGPKRAAGGPKRAAGRQSSSRTPLFGGLFSGGKKSAPEPKQVAQKAKKAAAAGASKVGGTKKIGTKRAGTSRVGGTSRISTKRTGAVAPRRIKLDEESSSTLGAAGVFSLGLATSAFLLFSAFTGVEGPAEAVQVAQQTANRVSQVASEIGSIADAGDENSKIAEGSKKAAEAAQQPPTNARSVPSPQVADASPTGRAGSGLSEQKPSQAETSKIPSGKAFSSLSKTNEVAGLGENLLESAAGKAEQGVESVPGPQGLLGQLFGSGGDKFGAPSAAQESRTSPEKEGLKPSAALESAANKLSGRSDEQEEVRQQDKAIQKGSKYDQAAAAQKNEPGSAEGNSVIDRKTLVPSSGTTPQKTTSGLFSSNPTPMQTPVSAAQGVSSAKNEVANVADISVESAAGKAEQGVESVPGPQGLLGRLFGSGGDQFGAPSAAQGSRTSPEKEGLKPSPALESAANKLSGRSDEQDKARQEDKAIQKGSKYDEAAAAQKNEPGSAEGNSVIDRKTLVPDSGTTPQKTTSGLFSSNPTPTQTPVSNPKGLFGAKNEVANVAENPVEGAVEQVEETAEKVAKKIPSPDGLIDAPKFEEITSIEESGFKPNAKFEEAAKKLRGSAEEQFKRAREADKGIQSNLDFEKAASLAKEEPGSKQGNSVFGRKEIVSNPQPGPPTPAGPFSSQGSQAAPAAPNSNLLLVGGGVVVAAIAAVVSQQKGGDLQKEASKAADAAKEQASAASGASNNGSDGPVDVKADIEERKKDAQNWIKEWRSK